jgi:hypothetical protein
MGGAGSPGGTGSVLDSLGSIGKSILDFAGLGGSDGGKSLASYADDKSAKVAQPPSYADGSPGYAWSVMGKQGSSYPATAQQDSREPHRSHLAVINSNELVVPAQAVKGYLNSQIAQSAVGGTPSMYSSRNSRDTYNYNQQVNYQQPNPTTFNQPAAIGRAREREWDNRRG